MNGHDVTLSWPELRLAGHIGIDRFVRARARKWRALYGQGQDEWWAHVLGAWGEIVVAKAANIYWPGDLGCPDNGRPDVGGYHVRARTRSDYDLIIRDDDDDDGRFVLVVPGALPRFRIIGECLGREGKLPEYRRDYGGRPPAYFVPQDALRPLDGLP